MKRFFHLISAATVLSVIMVACTMGQTPPPGTQIPGLEGAAVEPVATEAPLEAATPELVAIDLAGPRMELGSRYTWVDGSILAAVPGGPFIMGYNNFSDTREHEVTPGDFWIYTNEVTNQQYAACLAAGKCTAPDKAGNPDFDSYRFVNFPVVGVNHEQAAAYCEFVHGRLPTEAEWEKAARGEEGNLFPWGNQAPVCDLLNFDYCEGKLTKVFSYPEGVSYYGLFDMSGNVREWVADWYKPEYDTSAEASVDPLGPEFGEKRSVRSSSFADSGDSTFASHRFSLKPVDHLPDLGFRCVVDDPTYFAPFCEGLVLYGADISGVPNVPVISVADDCVQANLSSALGGCGTGKSYVTFNPWPLPPGATEDVDPAAACNGDRPTATCTGTGTISIHPQVCDFAPPPGVDPSCSPGYISEPDPGDPSKIICKGQGPGANCPAGFELDPLLNCCSAVNPGPNQYGFCIGFDMVGSDCYNDPDEPNQPHLVTLNVAPPVACNDGPCTDDPATPVNECGDDGACPPPETWVCTRDPACAQYPTSSCPYPDICSCQ